MSRFLKVDDLVRGHNLTIYKNSEDEYVFASSIIRCELHKEDGVEVYVIEITDSQGDSIQLEVPSGTPRASYITENDIIFFKITSKVGDLDIDDSSNFLSEFVEVPNPNEEDIFNKISGRGYETTFEYSLVFDEAEFSPQVRDWFTSRTLDDCEREFYEEIQKAGMRLAQLILDTCPSSADRTVAIRKVRESVINAYNSLMYTQL